MSARQVVLWRHGQTAYNAEARMQGQTDVPLDEIGLAQVEEAAAVVARSNPDLIVSSDLMRAQQTAQALGRLVGGEPVTDARLREREYGLWEGLTGAEIEAGWPDEFAQWRQGLDPIGTGIEPRGKAGARMASAITEWAERCDGTLVVVSHGGAITCAMIELLELDPEQWLGLRGLGNAHFSVIWPNPGRSPMWRVVAHNIGMFTFAAAATGTAKSHPAL